MATENEEYTQAFEHIKELAVAMKGLYDQAYQVYSSMVNDVLSDRITKERDIERVMDGLLDYAEDERFIKLYKDLCRHVYHHRAVDKVVLMGAASMVRQQKRRQLGVRYRTLSAF